MKKKNYHLVVQNISIVRKSDSVGIIKSNQKTKSTSLNVSVFTVPITHITNYFGQTAVDAIERLP